MLEATCGKCGETFNPADPQDIIHVIRENGQFCGGTGDITGEYRTSTPPPTYEDREAQAAYDDFWERY